MATAVERPLLELNELAKLVLCELLLALELLLLTETARLLA